MLPKRKATRVHQCWLWTALLAGGWWFSREAFAGETDCWKKVPGVSVGDYKPEFLKRVETELDALPCYGKCQASILECLRREPPSPSATRLARGVLQLMAGGADHDRLVEWLAKRKAMAYPEETFHFRLDGLQPFGKTDAPVVVVQFSDFHCPFCSKVTPIVQKVVSESNGRARLYLKQFPIKGQAISITAAKACVASDRLGKFWPYCSSLFEQSRELSEELVLDLAERAGMDRQQFQAELKSEAVLDRVADEKMEGLRARIDGLPTFFINGKRMLLEATAELLAERLEEEADILAGRD